MQERRNERERNDGGGRSTQRGGQRARLKTQRTVWKRSRRTRGESPQTQVREDKV